ncbi:hypothetical protein C8F01DRAFT_2928 [Mycena amicta]|nr:hypothetical protein C8F01DRAFT_2928 [Mycena amicta]
MLPFVSTTANRAADRARLDKIDEEIVHLKLALQTLYSEREAVQDRLESFTYPVLTLPNEVSLEIFKKYIPSYPECPPLVGDASPTKLGQICRHWRQIAHSSAVLWRGIEIPDVFWDETSALAQFETAETWLKRSGSLPLSVRLGLARNEDGGDIVDKLVHIGHTFLRHCGRWEYARWKLSHKGYLIQGMPFLAGRMPLLKELHVDTATPDKVGRVDAPFLRSVTGWLLSETSYSTLFSTKTWNQLTRLKLDDISPSFAAKILAETKDLLDCWLILSFDHFYRQEDQSMTDLELPRLETLIIGSDTSHSSHVFLAALNLPGLRRLSVKEDLLSPDPLQRLPETINSFGCGRLQRLCIVHRVVALEDEYRAVFPEIEHFEFDSSRHGGWSPSIEDWGGPWA